MNYKIRELLSASEQVRMAIVKVKKSELLSKTF